jgi:predicted metalloprotease with PDZ domain
MNIKSNCLLCSLLLAVFSFAEQVPKHLLDGLSSEQFKIRETSETELQKWTNEKGLAGIKAICKVQQESNDPEVRFRCLRVLRSQSDQDYLKDGEGYLGVQLWEEMLDVPGDKKPRACVRITFVIPGSQAEKAGMKVGDVITSMDGTKWYERGALEQLIQTVASYNPLKKVVFEIKRPGEDELIEVPVILGKRPVKDLSMMYYSDLDKLEKDARDKHFEEWLEKQKAAQ